MKNYTCDKCGMPMENRNKMIINNKQYDICSDCQSIIMKGLTNKGETIVSPEQKTFNEEIKRKFYKHYENY